MASAIDVMVNDHAAYVPAAPLRPFVAGWTGYRDVGLPPGLHRGLPSPFLTVIFTLDDPLIMAAHPDPAQRPGSFETLIGGLHTSPALIRHEGQWSGVQLRLTPLGARVLLDVPAGELAGIDVHGCDVLGAAAGQIRDQLRETDCWPGRFALLEQILLDRLRAADRRSGISREVSYAWEHLLQTGGTASVAELVSETGWSDRHLRTMFRLETGLGPKEAGRVIRFDRVRHRLQQRAVAGQQLALADLAATTGYFDQAHLNRDFRRMAGCPPTTWVVDEFQNFRADAADPPD